MRISLNTMKFVGTIHGEVKAESFDILLSTPIEKGSFVKIHHESYGWVLARITALRRFIKDNDEMLIASARVIGYKSDSGVVSVPKAPFKPEEKVFAADRDLIMDVIGLNRSRHHSIYLGYLEGHNIPVHLDIQKTIGKHICVLAKTGAGKSYTVAVILEELLKAKIPLLIIDPHGEYSSLKYENDDFENMLKFGVKPRSYEKQINEYAANIVVNPEAMKLTLKPEFSFHELVEILPIKLTELQKSILYESLKSLEGRDYTLRDLINVVKSHEDKGKWKVVSALELLRDSGIFEGKPLDAKDLVKEGQATIINLKGSELFIQQLIVAKLAKDLFDALKLGKIPPFFFLIEEAHNFCPERGFGDTLASQIIRNIASEGRKFGFYLCVVSQRPARVDKNVLSQCNTQIILKVTNPNDLKAISQSIEGFTSGMEEEIKQLSVGQALVVGECVEQPIIVNVRARETKHMAITPLKRESKEEVKEEESILEKIKPIFLKETDDEIVEKKPLKEEKRKTLFDRIKYLFLKEEERVQ
ncbi:MAG TPA: ATP-binding protein [Candidatus Altiarchaeales archaeon]|nr:ATP-binding protein [Candidatus Altiarchaeales archaeon]